MKKIICLLLMLCMLVSVAACGNLTTPPDQTDKQIDTTDAPVTTEPPKYEASAYDGIFKVGYDRQSIAPAGDIYLKDGTHMTSVLDTTYATCIAINDGETTVLMFTVDAGNVMANAVRNARTKISSATGIPQENILISGTHSHSAPQPETQLDKTVNAIWNAEFYQNLATAAKNAIADLSDAEIYVGSTEAKDMSFVRRWIYEDGTPGGIWRQPTDKKKVAYESESDDLCQFIRFVRAEKKDILLTNWGIHFTNANGQFPNAVSADLGGAMRATVEVLDEDVLFAYFIAPSGNISFTPYVDGTKKYGSYQKMAGQLSKQIVDEMDNLTKLEAGKIQIDLYDYEVKVRKDDADTVAKAQKAQQEISALKLYDGDAKVYEVCAKYGFESAKEVNSIVSRNKSSRGTTEIAQLSAVSFGDVGLVGVPYEMFDTNGIETREASPFKVTLVVTGCGGSAGYVPSALAVPNGGYEVYTTPWEFGTAELIVGELVRMLREQAF